MLTFLIFLVTGTISGSVVSCTLLYFDMVGYGMAILILAVICAFTVLMGMFITNANTGEQR